jgi:hypothetical protein
MTAPAVSDRPPLWIRGLLAAGVAAAVNLTLLALFRNGGFSFRVPIRPGTPGFQDLTPVSTIVASVGAALLATLLAWFLERRASRPRQFFNWIVVVVAVGTLLNLPMLDNEVIDKVAQSLLHLVEGAALVALVGPALSDRKPGVTDRSRG